MISDFFYNLGKILKSRLFIIGLIVVVMFGALIFRLYDLQIKNENYYMSTYIQKAEKTVYASGTRGNIYDCKGRLLAYDTLAYVVTIEDKIDSSDDKNTTLNQIVEKTINIIESNGDSVIVDLPIVKDEDGRWKYNFDSESARKLFIRNLFGNDPVRDGVDYSKASAQNMFYYLKNDLFQIGEHDNDTLLKILSIRYNLYLNSYRKYVSVVIAKDISQDTMIAIRENAADIPGVSVEEKNIRKYKDSKYFAPIVGYTGTITESELSKYNNNGGDYVNTDIVGKQGIEASMEKELQGKRGEEKIFVDSAGKILNTISKTDSRAGNNVHLTIDAKLQKAVYTLLEKKICSILISEIVNHDVNERKEDDKEVHYVSVKRVYSQLVANNIVSISHLSAHPSANEKHTYKKYKAGLQSALSRLESRLRSANLKSYNKSSNEFKEYYDYIYDYLVDNEIINTGAIDTEDDVYINYVKGKTNISDFLKYAIKSNWINLDNMNIKDQYLSTEETFDLLVNYLIDDFKDNSKFGKLVASSMIFKEKIHGSEILMLLFDQGVLKMSKKQYHRLEEYNSDYNYYFIVDKIKNLEITPAQLALDPCSGSVVMTDPKTGEVKAMVTYPSYDNNKLSGSVDPVYWNKLVEDQASPLYNRATQGLTAPGSTFKMCTSMAALDEDVVGVYETVDTKGKFKKVTPNPKCWIYPQAHGEINLVNAIAESCNCFFYEMGWRLGHRNGKFESSYGLDRLEKYCKKLGLDQKSGVEIQESNPHFSTESIVHSAIGQGSHAFAPVQLARYTSTIANDGTNNELTLVGSISSYNGKTVDKAETKTSNKIKFDSTTLNAIQQGMRKVITDGTVVRYFGDIKVDVAGKTGTAQENKKRNSHALFVCYAPYKKPKVAMSTVIPFGNSSSDAAKLSKQVLKYYFGEIKDKDLKKPVKKIKLSTHHTD